MEGEKVVMCGIHKCSDTKKYTCCSTCEKRSYCRMKCLNSPDKCKVTAADKAESFRFVHRDYRKGGD